MADRDDSRNFNFEAYDSKEEELIRPEKTSGKGKKNFQIGRDIGQNLESSINAK